jgi:hypothetical protein
MIRPSGCDASCQTLGDWILPAVQVREGMSEKRDLAAEDFWVPANWQYPFGEALEFGHEYIIGCAIDLREM